MHEACESCNAFTFLKNKNIMNQIATFELISSLVKQITKGKLNATFIDNDNDFLRKITVPELNISIEISHTYEIISGDNFFLSFSYEKGSEHFLLDKSSQSSIIILIKDTISYLKGKAYREILEQINKE